MLDIHEDDISMIIVKLSQGKSWEKKSEKIWVNRDGDDHLDEFYGNGDHGFETKYQNICDIIKK